MESEKEIITIFTDGSSRGNPGPGGYAAIIKSNGKVREIGGYEKLTTNNRMEIQALIEAIIAIKRDEGDVLAYTDSKYLIQGATEWVETWIKNGWQTKAKEAVLNKDLWEVLTGLLYERELKGEVTLKYIAGHSGIPINERADEIAVAFAEKEPIELYNGPAEKYPIDLSIVEVEIKTGQSENVEKKKRSQTKAYSYVSCVDGKIETHKTWAECEKRVLGKSGAKFKKAFSAEDEKIIIAGWS